MSNFIGQWGKALWGLGRWANPLGVSTTTNIVGQGVMTANIPPIPVLGSGSIVGQGVMTGSGIILIFGSVNIVGQGVFFSVINCPLDSVVTLYLIPRATVSVIMPIAYVTEVTNYSSSSGCAPNTNTIPVTGSLTSIVEGNDGEAL